MPQYIYVGVPQWTITAQGRALGGLFRQPVGASEWQHVVAGLPDKVEVRVIAIHPHDSQVVYAGTQYGPYRSMDGGERWERLEFPEHDGVVWTIVFHPQNPDILYLGVAPAAIYRSDNGGTSWRRLPIVAPTGAVRMSFPMRVIRLAIDPLQPQNVYAALEVGGVIRSEDGGETWRDCTPALLTLAEQPHLKSQLGSDTDVEGMMDAHAIVVSSTQPAQVFLANRMGLFSSRDRGESWRELEIWRFSPFAYGRDIQTAPDNARTLYAALSPAAMSQAGSIYRSQDLGETWERFDHGVVPRRTMMAVAVSRQDSRCVYGVNSLGQVFGTRDGGVSWAEFPLPAGLRNVYTIACA
ncbi:MAG: WD40/YVTN/BNR-like repeat-containing protein [Candidatus Binatia bacterium]